MQSKVRNVTFIHKEGDIQLQRLPRAGRDLARKIFNRTAKIGIVGLAYRGLGLAVEMAKDGFHVTGIDMDRDRIESVSAGISYLVDVPDDVLFSLVSEEKLEVTQSLAVLKDVDVVIVCDRSSLIGAPGPAIPYINSMAEALKGHIRRGQILCLEYFSSPGMTRQVVARILGYSELRIGEDFFLVYSCDGGDPENSFYTARTVPRVIGGVTSNCTTLGKLLYGQGSDNTVALSSADCAEMVSLFGRSFFSVNAAMVMETALMCRKFGLDIREVIDAAKSQGFGFMSFDPGINDHYHGLMAESSSSIREMKSDMVHPLLDVAMDINSQVPAYIVARVGDVLNEAQRSLKGSNILGLGVTPNPHVSDFHGSLAVHVLEDLQTKGATVYFSDPLVSSLTVHGVQLRSQPISAEVLQMMDLRNCADRKFRIRL